MCVSVLFVYVHIYICVCVNRKLGSVNAGGAARIDLRGFRPAAAAASNATATNVDKRDGRYQWRQTNTRGGPYDRTLTPRKTLSRGHDGQGKIRGRGRNEELENVLGNLNIYRRRERT